MNLNERALVASCNASPALPCRLSHLDRRIISYLLWEFYEDILLILQSKLERCSGGYLLRLRRKWSSSFPMAGPRWPMVANGGTWGTMIKDKGSNWSLYEFLKRPSECRICNVAPPPLDGLFCRDSCHPQGLCLAKPTWKFFFHWFTPGRKILTFRAISLSTTFS